MQSNQNHPQRTRTYNAVYNSRNNYQVSPIEGNSSPQDNNITVTEVLNDDNDDILYLYAVDTNTEQVIEFIDFTNTENIEYQTALTSYGSTIPLYPAFIPTQHISDASTVTTRERSAEIKDNSFPVYSSNSNCNHLYLITPITAACNNCSKPYLNFLSSSNCSSSLTSPSTSTNSDSEQVLTNSSSNSSNSSVPRNCGSNLSVQQPKNERTSQFAYSFPTTCIGNPSSFQLPSISTSNSSEKCSTTLTLHPPFQFSTFSTGHIFQLSSNKDHSFGFLNSPIVISSEQRSSSSSTYPNFQISNSSNGNTVRMSNTQNHSCQLSSATSSNQFSQLLTTTTSNSSSSYHPATSACSTPIISTIECNFSSSTTPLAGTSKNSDSTGSLKRKSIEPTTYQKTAHKKQKCTLGIPRCSVCEKSYEVLKEENEYLHSSKCGHLYCLSCISTLKKCVKCKKIVGNLIKVYF